MGHVRTGVRRLPRRRVGSPAARREAAVRADVARGFPVRAAFAAFDVASIAAFDERDVARLLADAGIVRNRAKIEATISNARRVVEAVPEGLDALLWSFAPDESRRPLTLADVPARTPASVAMARELRKRGFRFVGPTTAYALMQ